MALFDERGPWMTPCELLDDRKLVHVPKYLNVLSFHCLKRPFIEKFFKLGYLVFALWVGLKFNENGFQIWVQIYYE